MSDAPERAFTAAQKRTAIRRELGMRRTVYKRQVEQGKMTRAAAAYEIGVFEAIKADYAAQAEVEKKAGELPGL